MRPAVLTAVLLLVDILNTEATGFFPWFNCANYESCGAGWTKVTEKRCLQFIDYPETFSDAKIVCREIYRGELMSKPSRQEIDYFFCSEWNTHSRPLWVVDTAAGPNTCTELTFEIPRKGYHVANCSQRKVFFCAKNKR